jgi:hypothetical protein
MVPRMTPPISPSSCSFFLLKKKKNYISLYTLFNLTDPHAFFFFNLLLPYILMVTNGFFFLEKPQISRQTHIRDLEPTEK